MFWKMLIPPRGLSLGDRGCSLAGRLAIACLLLLLNSVEAVVPHDHGSHGATRHTSGETAGNGEHQCVACRATDTPSQAPPSALPTAVALSAIRSTSLDPLPVYLSDSLAALFLSRAPPTA